MKTLTARKDGDYIVRITGDVDHHATQGLRETIDRELDSSHPTRLILDLGATEFMDSSGLGLILGRLRKTREMGIELILVDPSDAVMKILRLAGVEKMLDVRMLKRENA